MKVFAGDLFAALVTAVGYQTDTEKGKDRKSQFLTRIELMLEAIKRGENLEIVWPDDLNELA